MELVDVECAKAGARWLIKLFIDKDGGVTLGDCQKVSDLSGDILDIHETPTGPYILEVSSPGLDRALTRDKDFFRFSGRRVKARTAEKIDGRRNFYGTLIDYTQEDEKRYVILEENGEHIRIPRQSIVKIHLDSNAEQPLKGAARGKRDVKKKL